MLLDTKLGNQWGSGDRSFGAHQEEGVHKGVEQRRVREPARIRLQPEGHLPQEQSVS